MPIQEINYKGAKIIAVDFEGCKSKQDMLDMGQLAIDHFLNHTDSHLRIFFDYTQGFATREYMKIAKEGRDKLLKIKTTSSAAIGITGMKKVLLKGYNAMSTTKGIVPFDSKEEALDYLATSS